MSDPVDPGRRQMLGAAALAMSGVGLPAAAAAEPLDLNSPRGNGYAYVKLHSDTSGATLGFNGLRGIIYSVVGDNGPVTPLFGCESFGVGRAEPLADGTFRYFLTSTTLITDLVTHQPLTEWRNPETGERVEVSHTHFPAVCWVIGADPTATSVGGSGRPTAWEVTGDQAVYTAHNSGVADNPLDPDKWPRESAGRRIRTAEFAKVFASLAQLQDRSLTTAPYVGVWNSMTPWEPWMLMGQAPGHLFMSATIRRLDGAGGIDPKVRDFALARWPGCLTPPTAWTTERVSPLEAYARDHRPAPPS